MPRKQNTYDTYGDTKYRSKIKLKNSETTTSSFAPQTPNIKHQNPFTNTDATLSKKNPDATSVSFGSQPLNVCSENPFDNTHSPLLACNAAMLDFSTQTIFPIEGGDPAVENIISQHSGSPGMGITRQMSGSVHQSHLLSDEGSYFPLDNCGSLLQSRIRREQRQVRRKRKKNSSKDEHSGPPTGIESQCHPQTSQNVACSTNMFNIHATNEDSSASFLQSRITWQQRQTANKKKEPASLDEGPSNAIQQQYHRHRSPNIEWSTESGTVETTNEVSPRPVSEIQQQINRSSLRNDGGTSLNGAKRRKTTSRNVTHKKHMHGVQGNNERSVTTLQNQNNQSSVEDHGEASSNNASRRGNASHNGARNRPLQNIQRTNEDASPSYEDIGDCSYRCRHSGAGFWYGERVQRASTISRPEYHLCCKDGKIIMDQEADPPQYIKDLLSNAAFMENIRAYNQMFAMTSFGATIDKSVNNGRGPYVFKVSGQIYHWVGTLCPVGDDEPAFMQLYIYDTQNEVRNRLNHFPSSDTCKMRSLTQIFVGISGLGSLQ